MSNYGIRMDKAMRCGKTAKTERSRPLSKCAEAGGRPWYKRPSTEWWTDAAILADEEAAWFDPRMGAKIVTLTLVFSHENRIHAERVVSERDWVVSEHMGIRCIDTEHNTWTGRYRNTGHTRSGRSVILEDDRIGGCDLTFDCRNNPSRYWLAECVLRLAKHADTNDTVAVTDNGITLDHDAIVGWAMDVKCEEDGWRTDTPGNWRLRAMWEAGTHAKRFRDSKALSFDW